MIMTNERFVFLDFDLNEIKHLEQFFIHKFQSEAYSMNLIATSHIDGCGFILSCGIEKELERNQYKAEFLSPWCDFDTVAMWLMRA